MFNFTEFLTNHFDSLLAFFVFLFHVGKINVPCCRKFTSPAIMFENDFAAFAQVQQQKGTAQKINEVHYCRKDAASSTC